MPSGRPTTDSALDRLFYASADRRSSGLPSCGLDFPSLILLVKVPDPPIIPSVYVLLSSLAIVNAVYHARAPRLAYVVFVDGRSDQSR